MIIGIIFLQELIVCVNNKFIGENFRLGIDLVKENKVLFQKH